MSDVIVVLQIVLAGFVFGGVIISLVEITEAIFFNKR